MKYFWALVLLFLTGCSGLPKAMRETPYTNVNLQTVKMNISAYEQVPVRWGGTLVNVTNAETSSQAQLLYYPLSRYGRPRVEIKTEGRFSITQNQVLDPAIFKEGVELTVTGILSGEIKQKIGEKTVILPQVNIKHIHIWPKRLQNNRYYQHYPYYFPYSYYSYPYFRSNFYYDYYY